MRSATTVRNGSFAAASANASLGSSSVAPSISKMILPGWISDTKYSGLPLPFPMRTSAGLDEIGLSGNTRIQMRPPRLMWRDIARRAASTCRAGRRPRVVALRPDSPKATRAPRRPRLMWRDIGRRAASSCRAVRRPRVVAFRPYSPKATRAPRVATPVLRPFCCLRYFVRAGWSMAIPCLFLAFFLAFAVARFLAGDDLLGLLDRGLGRCGLLVAVRARTRRAAPLGARLRRRPLGALGLDRGL